MKRRYYGDALEAWQRLRLKKQKRAGTDPETQRDDERKVWWGMALVLTVLGFLAGMSGRG